MAGNSDDGWHLVVGQPAIEIREEKQIQEWESSKGGWSGCGKHPANWTDHKKLHVSQDRELGSGSYGLVQRVTYGAVTMARKHVMPRGGMTVEQLREEANAMEELAHKHIVKLVGTYTLKRKHLYLLLYPAATCDLSTFIEDIDGIRSDTCADRDDAMKRLHALGLKNVGRIEDLPNLRRAPAQGDRNPHISRSTTALGFLQQIMGCITEALIFVHKKGIRHRDLKPKNILLSTGRVYLADFGIARDVKESEDSITCGRCGTASWIAPEVYDGQDHHMSPADIFSLGCIFLNIATVLYGDSTALATFDEVMKEREWLKKYGLLSRHLNELRTRAIKAQLANEEELNFNAKNILGLVEKMLSFDAVERPTAEDVNLRLLELGGLDQIYHLSCCHKNNDFLANIINFKLRRVAENSVLSSTKIAKLEAENRNLQDRLSFLELNHGTWEARLENERKHAGKQFLALKEKYDKEVEARKSLEERLRALESPSHKRHSSNNRGRNKSHGTLHTNPNQHRNSHSPESNHRSALKVPQTFALPRNPSSTNLVNQSLTRKPSLIPLPTRSSTPITTTPSRPSFPRESGSATSTLVSSTHSIFSNRSTKSTDSVSSLEDGTETLRLSPPESPTVNPRLSGIGKLSPVKVERGVLNRIKDAKEKEKDRNVRPSWANMVAKTVSNLT
ncbi:hypothetical protein ACMFMG_005867 [Clarireedia jacksonii]